VLVEGPGPRLFLQRVPEAKTVKNRAHLDVVTQHLDAELARLISLGAKQVERYESHVLLTDPQGNEFCLMQGPAEIKAQV
jgi:hypothetical protein